MSNSKSVSISSNHSKSGERVAGLNHVLDNFQKKLEAIDFIVEDPICSGYLKYFCESQYCVENVYFVVEVGKFCDMFEPDKTAWGSKSWRQIDKEIGWSPSDASMVSTKDGKRIDFSSTTRKFIWPSSVVGQGEVKTRLQWIWNTFICDHAPSQICIPSYVRNNTIQRLNLVHLYGGEAFKEALAEALKTLQRDTLPRFLSSDVSKEMQRRVHELEKPVTAASLVVPPPTLTPVTGNVPPGMARDLVEDLQLPDVVRDRCLYLKFLQYLEGIHASENLLCMRMIEKYKEMFPFESRKEKDPNKKLAFASSDDIGRRSCRGSFNQNAMTSIHNNVSWASGQNSVQSAHNSLGSNRSSGRSKDSVNILKNHFYGPAASGDAVEMAWKIFIFFVQPRAPYEVGISHRRQKEVCMNMANPRFNTFDAVEKSAKSALREHFRTFKQAPVMCVDFVKELEAATTNKRRKQARENALWYRLLSGQFFRKTKLSPETAPS